MTAFELCGVYNDETFKLKNGSVIWESISYSWKTDKCFICRVVEKDKGGKPWFLGLNSISRYISCDTIIRIVKK